MTVISQAAVAFAATLACVLLAGREGPAGVHAQAPLTSSAASGALQRGLTLMETRGDCNAALPHFESAARAAESATAARALLLAGQCHERLGRQSHARDAYERLARRFASHPLAGQARRRLATLPGASVTPRAPGLALRRLHLGHATIGSSYSADGRHVAYLDDSGQVWRQDTASGRREALTSLNAGPEPRVWELLLSPTGRDVAFTWADERRRGELRVVPAHGGAPRVLVPAGSWQVIRPLAWTPDGRQLVVLTMEDSFEVALRLVDVSSGAMRLLRDLGVSEPFAVSMAPDGRVLLYDHAPEPGRRDVFAIHLDTGEVWPVVAHGSEDALPVFLPNGRGFLFASDRLGPLSLWRQAWPSRGVTGEPTLVRRDVGRIWPIAMLASGTMIHGQQTGVVDVHVARLQGGEAPAVPLTPPVTATFAGNNLAPDWSSDGRSLAYVATRGAFARGRHAQALVIRDHGTGQERLVHTDLLFMTAPRWSPDGSRIIVKGRSSRLNRWGLFVVDVRTGATSPALTATSVDEESELGPYQWIPGREALIVGRHGKALVEFDLTTSEERVLEPLAPGTVLAAGRGCAFAPDGVRLAWAVREGRGSTASWVLRLREKDGAVRELWRQPGPDWFQSMTWAPDGQALYVVRNTAGADGYGELWRVPLEGAPRPAGLRAASLRGVAVHPDGQTVAYVSGLPTWELWAMDGLD